MRNKYIKFCDKHRITDGLLRELLHKELLAEASVELMHVQMEINRLLDAVLELSKEVNRDRAAANEVDVNEAAGFSETGNTCDSSRTGKNNKDE